jgi:hypothetical protein
MGGPSGRLEDAGTDNYSTVLKKDITLVILFCTMHRVFLQHHPGFRVFLALILTFKPKNWRLWPGAGVVAIPKEGFLGKCNEYYNKWAIKSGRM